MKEITDEELASFLEGTLPEEREKEVAEAIDNSKELQEIIEASLDIDDIMMFEELRLAKYNPQADTSSPNLTFTVTDSASGTKWGKYLSRTKGSTSRTSTPFTTNKDNHVPRKGTFRREAAAWEEEEYRRAADREKTKMIKLKSKKRVRKDGDDGHSYWTEIIIGIIALVIFALIRTCS